jgi:hypothetical protein
VADVPSGPRLDSTPHYVKVKVKVTLRLTVSQSVSKSWCRAPFGAHDLILITVWQLRSSFCGVPSLTRGRVCLLSLLLAFASAVFLGSESLGTRDHILLSQIRDFPFCRLVQLAGSRWRYSTPPFRRRNMRHRSQQLILTRPARYSAFNDLLPWISDFNSWSYTACGES